MILTEKIAAEKFRADNSGFRHIDYIIKGDTIFLLWGVYGETINSWYVIPCSPKRLTFLRSSLDDKIKILEEHNLKYIDLDLSSYAIVSYVLKQL